MGGSGTNRSQVGETCRFEDRYEREGGKQAGGERGEGDAAGRQREIRRREGERRAKGESKKLVRSAEEREEQGGHEDE